MKLFISICLFAMFILNAQPGFSQKEVEISGVKYLLHSVTKGETVYSLCLKYKVTQDELHAANPGLKAVLKSGSTVKIPVKNEIAEQKPQQAPTKVLAIEPEYYYHKVNKKQTIFSIAKQYGISANELIRFNPEISNGLKMGQVLKIPVLHNKTDDSNIQSGSIGGIPNKSVSTPSSGTEYKTHTVVAGETLYSLEQKYGVTREQIISLNPAIQNGLQTGTRLKIPERITESNRAEVAPTAGSTEVVVPEMELGNCNPISGRNTQKYKVAFLLPLYLQGNDHVNQSELNTGIILSKIDIRKLSGQFNTGATDSVAISAIVNIEPRAESFIEFYEGALLAIDSLQKKGMNIECYVFDAANQNMINALLHLDVFRDLDLIIGPVYPELQESVALFADKNRIPMVSPLASTGNFEEKNPYYFKVNPTREYQIEQTAKYIADEFNYKNLVLLKLSGNSNSPEAKLAELGKAKLLAARQSTNNRGKLFHEYSFQQQGLNSVKPLLDESGENIFIIPTDNEAQVSVAVTNLNALAENYDVVLMGTSHLTKLKSIQTENYHHVKLRYLSPTFIDYTKPLVRRFVTEYRETFAGEPSQFSYQGFDVTYYFLSALNIYGKDFRGCLPNYPMELTQTVFNFGRVTPTGGFMNRALFITAWERNYDVKNYGIVGGEAFTK